MFIKSRIALLVVKGEFVKTSESQNIMKIIVDSFSIHIYSYMNIYTHSAQSAQISQKQDYNIYLSIYLSIYTYIYIYMRVRLLISRQLKVMTMKVLR